MKKITYKKVIKEVEVIDSKYLECDNCKNLIPKGNYYSVEFLDSIYGNDTHEMIEYLDFCDRECMLEHMIEQLEYYNGEIEHYNITTNYNI